MGIPIDKGAHVVYHPQTKKVSSPLKVGGQPYIPAPFSASYNPVEVHNWNGIPSSRAVDPSIEYYASLGKRAGIRPSFGTRGSGTMEEQLADLSMLIPFFGPERGAVEGPGMLAKLFSRVRGSKTVKAVKNYPTGTRPASKYPLQKMGQHAQFGEDVQRMLQIKRAPSIEEHMATLDALKNAQGGVEPSVLRGMFDREEMGVNRGKAIREYFQNSGGSRSNTFDTQDAIRRNWPELIPAEVPHPSMFESNPFHENELPQWLTHNWAEGVQLPESIQRRAGLNRAVERGSFMDKGMRRGGNEAAWKRDGAWLQDIFGRMF